MSEIVFDASDVPLPSTTMSKVYGMVIYEDRPPRTVIERARWRVAAALRLTARIIERAADVVDYPRSVQWYRSEGVL